MSTIAPARSARRRLREEARAGVSAVHRRLERGLLDGQAGEQVAREAGAPARGAQEVGVGGEPLAAHAEIADLARRHQHHHRGLAADREGQHRAEALDAAREVGVLPGEGPAAPSEGAGDREAGALEIHGAEARDVGDLLADLE
jgi:hypothetical protein